jgi:2-haloacid dehalogenase
VLDFEQFEWISFDCYGTLVDWETGICDAAARVFARHGVRRTRAEILAMFSDAEPKVQSSGEFLEYRTVLRDVMEIMAWEASIRLPRVEADSLPDSLPNWPVFPDAASALTMMQQRYKLAIISNVDDDLFEGTAKAIGIDFDAVVTSQQAGSYKPDLQNFHLAQERLSTEKERWLHVGESLFHDIGPANRMGIASVWVNRPDRGGGSRRTDAVHTLEVPNLSQLAQLMFSM